VKPAWQAFLANSYFFQNSHLYSLLRNGFDGFSVKKRTASVEERNNAELNYSELLEAFVGELRKNDIKILFVSVTHGHDGLYRYDLDDFPLIKSEVIALSRAGSLYFVDLPLQQLEPIPGSLEGHQWSFAHHQIVGDAISAVILRMQFKML
jgi:hypothetical protein